MIAAPCGHGREFHGTPGIVARHIVLLGVSAMRGYSSGKKQ
jgi:hypothetical protein